ncbi:MAG: MmgE/PrpD family protein [Polyangiaceae bacterium]|jgi:2-methylcitrate dehydratase PrpD
MTDLAQVLAAHAAAFPAHRLDPRVREHLALDLVDGLAATVGGVKAPGVAELANVLSAQSGPGNAQRFATQERWPAVVAAQLNATAGHALDYDDTLDEGGGMHAGALVHSAALAVADSLGGVSGETFVAATAVGLDIAVRLALAPTRDFGWHRTSVFGVFGVVGAVGRLYGLNGSQFVNAFGIAYSQASGNRQCVADGALSKRLQAGFAARDGIVAAQLAKAGITGATRVFEGQDGFFPLYQRGEYVRERVTEGLGERLLSHLISLKPYPCGRNLHGFLDATARARAAHEGRTIEGIDVHLEAKSFGRATLTWPQHVVAAQFSIPFAVALSTATGRTSLADFDAPDRAPAAVKALFDRIRVQPHEGTPEEDRIVFHYSNGASHEERTAGVRLGHPANPVSREQTAEKLRDCNAFAGSPLSEAAVEQVLSAALGIASLPSTNTLTRVLRA